MLRMDLEYLSGILFIGLKGMLTGKDTNQIYNYVIPVANKHKIKEIVFDLCDLEYIDEYGLTAINEVKETLNKMGGDIYLYNVNEKDKRRMLSLNFKIISSQKLS